MNKKTFDNKNQILIYKTETGQYAVEVLLADDTVWLTQKQMAELFYKGRTTITEHIQNIFKEGELDKKLVCRNFRHTASDGKEYEVNIIT